MKVTENVYGNVNITAVVGGGSDGNGNLHVEDLWYKGQEWKYLGEKGRASAIKIIAGRKGPKKPTHQGKITSKKHKATERKVAELEKKVRNQRRQLDDMASSTSASYSNKYSGEEE